MTDYRKFIIDVLSDGSKLTNIANYREVLQDKEVMKVVMSSRFFWFIDVMKDAGVMKFDLNDCLWLLDQHRGDEALGCGFFNLDDDLQCSHILLEKLLKASKENGCFKAVEDMMIGDRFPHEKFKEREYVDIFLNSGFCHKKLFVYLGDDEEYMLECIKNRHYFLHYASSRLRGDMEFSKKVYAIFDCANDEDDAELFRDCFIGKVGKAIRTSGVVEFFEKNRLEALVGQGKTKERVKI